MNRTKLLISLVLAASVLFGQVGGVLAAPTLEEATSITGKVQSITLETDPNTGITTVIVEVIDVDEVKQTVRISQTDATIIGLVTLDDDGNPVINNLALGQSVEIDQDTVIPQQEEDRNPIADALATFFADIPDLDYAAIMAAHEEGTGFGVIAQALWLTDQFEGNAGDFRDLLEARETGDYTAFTMDDGSVPQSWGELRKAILDGKKPRKAKDVASDQASGNDQQQDKNKNKKDKNKDKNKDNKGSSGNHGNGGDKEQDMDK